MLSIILFVLVHWTTSEVSTTWYTNFDKAKMDAVDQEKDILIYFSGSDWCKPCIKLKQEILETEQFQQFASRHFILVLADFPKRKKNKLSEEQQRQNDALAEKYNLDGYFPLIVVTDGKGNIKGKTGYQNIAVEEYIDQLKKIKE